MAVENPPLNRIHVLGYTANDRNHPIISLVADPRVAGYRVPEDLSVCPDKRYPNHVFTGAQPLSGDERVRHTWEILPSPYVPFTRYDDDLGPVQGRRRFVVNSGQEASLERDKKISYEAREGSAIVSSEIEETWDAGSTDPDVESPFPIKDRDSYDPSRGAVQERRQLRSTTGNEVATLENKDGVITQTSYEAYNEFLSFKVVQTYSVDGPQLVGKATDNDGQLITVTTQRKGADNYTPPSPTATRTVEVNREDAESLVERIVDTPEVFKANTFSVERPDPIPQKFRVAVPIQSSQEIVEGDADPNVSLDEGELSKSEEQRNKFIKRVSSTSRDQAVLPQTLAGKSTNNERQEVVITETLQLGNTDETPTATTTIESEALGDGNYVITKTQVDEVFSAITFSKERPDPVPPKFRTAIPSLTRQENLEGEAQEPTLVAGEIVKSEQQVNQFVKRISTTDRAAIQLPKSLTQKLTTNEGLLATVTETLQNGDTTEIPTSKRTVESEALGDGTYVVRVTESPKVFSAKTFRAEKADLTPQKFRAKQSDLTTEENIEGTASQPTLDPDQFLKSEQQVNEFVKRVTTNNRITELTENLNESVITPEGQLATRTITLSKSAQTLFPSATVVDGDIEELGDGRTVKTEVKVSQVFDGKQESLEKPEVIPPEFRASLQNRTISEVKTGQAISLPSLSQDELSKTIQRVTEHKIRETKVTRPSSNYDPLTGELVDNDQIKVTRTRTVAKTNQTITPSATVSGTVEALGDGFTLKTEDTKAKVFAAKTFSQEKPDNIPVEFRAEKPVTIEEFTGEGEAQKVSLAGNEISKSEQQVTEFLKRTRTSTRDIIGGVTLEGGSQIDQDGVKVTVVRTLSDGSQIISPNALVSGSVEAIGDGKTIKTEMTKDKVFDQDQTTLSQAIQIPAKFIDREQEQESYVEEETSAEPEPLGDGGFGVVESSAQRVSEFTVRKNLRTISGVNTLKEKQLSNTGQEITITSAISDSEEIETGAKVEIARTQAIGGGKFLKEIGKVDEVFDAKQETLSQSVQIPTKFFDEEAKETSVIEEGTEADPEAVGTNGFGVVRSSAQRVNAFTVRKTKTEQSGTTSLTEKQTNNSGQEVTVKSSIASSPTITTGPTIEFSRSQSIGGGKFVTETGRVNKVFAGKTLSIEKPETIPAKFRVEIPNETEETTEEGNVSDAIDLGPDELSKSEQEIRDGVIRTRTTTRSAVPSASLTQKTTTNEKQLATVTESLQDGDTNIIPSATTNIQSEAIGDGKYIVTETSVPRLFGSAIYTVERVDVVPTKFKADLPTTVEERNLAKVIEVLPQLGQNEIFKSEQQINEFVTRELTRSRKNDSLEKTAEGQVYVSELNGGLAKVIEQLGRNPTITPSKNTVSAEKEYLGDDLYLTREVFLEETTTLRGQNYDETFDISVPFTREIIGAGELADNESAQIEPRNSLHSIKTVIDKNVVTDALEAYHVISGDVQNISLPDVLNSVTVRIYNEESGSNDIAEGSGNSASASASIGIDCSSIIDTNIKNGYSGPAKSTRHIFFLPEGGSEYGAILAKTGAQPWPVVRPKQEKIEVTTVSEQRSARVALSLPDNVSRSKGGGKRTSRSVVNIPPTLHGDITVTRSDDFGSPTASTSVSVSGPSGASASVDLRVESSNRIVPPSFSATSPSFFPSGLYLYSVNASPYRYGFLRVEAIVVEVTADMTS